MGHDNVVPRFGDEHFRSFNETLNYPPRGDAWPEALTNVGHWRQRDARLLRGAESEKIEGGDMKILEYIACEQGLKLGIPEDTSQAEMERALHTILTIAGIAASRARDIVDKDAKENAIDVEVRDQVADVLRYISNVLSQIEKGEADRLRPLYEQYGKQVMDLIFATRDGVLKDISLLDDFFASCPRP